VSPYRLGELIEQGILTHRRDGSAIKLTMPKSTAHNLTIQEIAEAKRLLLCEFCGADPSVIIGPCDGRPLPLCAGHYAQLDCDDAAFAWPPVSLRSQVAS
jgi:hypothetical protein